MKKQPKEFLGIEVGSDAITAVLMNQNGELLSVDWLDLPAPERWADTVAQWLPSIVKHEPAGLGVSLGFRSLQVFPVAVSSHHPHAQELSTWMQELYTGDSAQEFAWDCAISDVKGKPGTQISIRKEELLQVKSALAPTWLRPQIVDSALMAIVSAIQKTQKKATGLGLRVEKGRFQWVSLVEGTLRAWGDFSISMDAADANFWQTRLQEIMDSMLSPNETVWVCGVLLRDSDFVTALNKMSKQIKTLEAFKPLKGQTTHTAVFTAAWATALRLKEEL